MSVVFLSNSNMAVIRVNKLYKINTTFLGKHVYGKLPKLNTTTAYVED